MAIEFKEAIAAIAARREIASDLTTQEWASVPLALRERAFFSARVTNAQLLQALKSKVATILKPTTKLREDGTPFTDGLDIATARLEIKQLLDGMGYDAGEKRGTLEDLRSDQRINLQLRQNTQAAQGHGNFLQGQGDGALQAFPAQELYRLENRKEPRDWPTRWNGARGELGEASTAIDARIAMIALKSDPIWAGISAFDVPWPPFDFNSGMWVRDISRTRAEELGLVQPGEVVQSGVESFNESLKASVKDLDPEMIKALKNSFTGQITLKDGAAWWKRDRTGKRIVVPAKPKKPKRTVGQFPEQLDEVEDVKALGGSTGARLVRDKVTGEQYLMKGVAPGFAGTCLDPKSRRR